MNRKSGIITYISGGMLAVVMLIMIISVGHEMNHTVPKFFGRSLLYVTSGSMEPTYKEGDYLLAKETEASALEVGDVICFISTNPDIYGELNTHRIVDIELIDGERFYKTQGDANLVADGELVSESHVVGRIVKKLPVLRNLRKVMLTPVFFVFFIIAPLVVLVIGDFRNLLERLREKDGKNSNSQGVTREQACSLIENYGLLISDEKLVALVMEHGETAVQMLVEAEKQQAAEKQHVSEKPVSESKAKATEGQAKRNKAERRSLNRKRKKRKARKRR